MAVAPRIRRRLTPPCAWVGPAFAGHFPTCKRGCLKGDIIGQMLTSNGMPKIRSSTNQVKLVVIKVDGATSGGYPGLRPCCCPCLRVLVISTPGPCANWRRARVVQLQNRFSFTLLCSLHPLQWIYSALTALAKEGAEAANRYMIGTCPSTRPPLPVPIARLLLHVSALLLYRPKSVSRFFVFNSHGPRQLLRRVTS